MFYQFLVSLVAACVNSKVWINFNQQQSMFSFNNRGETRDFSYVFYILVIFCIFCFLSSFCFLIVYLFFKWIFIYDFVVFFMMILLSLIDLFAGFGITGFVRIYYDKWISYNPTTLLIPLAIIVIVWGAGYWISSRRDLLNAK